nr:MAG TPA: hypothetical protein [Caudoviricetes sp.]
MKANTIAEFYIYKWLEENGFYMPDFKIIFKGKEAIITDKNNDVMILEYREGTVQEKEY